MKSLFFSILAVLSSLAISAQAQDYQRFSRYVYLNQVVINQNMDLRNLLALYGPQFNGDEVESVIVQTQSSFNGQIYLVADGQVVAQNLFLSPQVVLNPNRTLNFDQNVNELDLAIRGQVGVISLSINYRHYDQAPPPQNKSIELTNSNQYKFVGNNQIDLNALFNLTKDQGYQITSIKITGHSTGGQSTYAQVMIDNVLDNGTYIPLNDATIEIPVKQVAELGQSALNLQLQGDIEIDSIAIKAVRP